MLTLILAAVLALPSSPHKLKDTPARNFVLPSVSGEEISLDGFSGKVVLLNFWATWCEPCKRELPEFERLQRKYASNGLIILAVSVDNNVENTRAFLRKNDLKLAALWDRDKRIAAAYDVEAMPSTYVIDRDGIIRFVHKGFSMAEITRIEAEVRELLNIN